MNFFRNGYFFKLGMISVPRSLLISYSYNKKVLQSISSNNVKKITACFELSYVKLYYIFPESNCKNLKKDIEKIQKRIHKNMINKI